MTAATLGQPRCSRPRAAVIAAASLVLHGLVLAPLALNLFGPSTLHPRPQYQGPVYLDITPRPSGRDRAERESLATPQPSAVTPGPPTESMAGPPAPVRPRWAEPPRDAGSPTEPAPTVANRWQVRPDDSAARVGTALRRSGVGCRMLAGRLGSTEQARCDRLFAEGASEAAPIAGTDDPVRDARFAAAGAQALADYERRRAPLKPNSRAEPCPHPTDLSGSCPVRVMVPVWSLTEGFLPGLKRDE